MMVFSASPSHVIEEEEALVMTADGRPGFCGGSGGPRVARLPRIRADTRRPVRTIFSISRRVVLVVGKWYHRARHDGGMGDSFVSSNLNKLSNWCATRSDVMAGYLDCRLTLVARPLDSTFARLPRVASL